MCSHKDWAANDPAEVSKVLGKLDSILTDFNAPQKDGTKISMMTDLIVLVGAAAEE